MKGFKCVDCQADTSGSGIREYYMLTHALWHETGMARNGGMLCIGCVETRLGRRLTKDDFLKCPLNADNLLFRKSDRLMNRLTTNKDGA